MFSTFHYEEDFVPPQENEAVPSLTRICLPLILGSHDLEVRTSHSCLDIMENLRNNAAVVMPNHTDRFDPLSVFALSKLCEENFYYVAARETFDEDFGLRGWFFQNLGAYSVMRGVHDVKYLQTTISLLTQGKRKLVLFGEGHVSGRDDHVDQIKEQAIGSLYIAQGEMRQKKPDPALFIIPLAIYYEVDRNAVASLTKAIAPIQAKLGLPDRNPDLQEKINVVMDALLNHLENYYGFRSKKGSSFQSRSHSLAQYVTTTYSKLLGIDVEENESELDTLYKVRSESRKPICSETNNKTEYWCRLNTGAKLRNRSLIADLDRIERLLVLAQIMRQQPTLETAWRMVDGFELEVTGAVTRKGRRTAWLEAGKPINLLDSWTHYQRDKDNTVRQTSRQVKRSIETVLRTVKRQHQPRVASAERFAAHRSG